jgi:4-hydroxy-3-methylbut-2-enyl diphosphate reductase
MKIVKARVLGFCGGVQRAVRMIETELTESGPLHTLGAIVHNAHVVNGLACKGALPVDSVDDVPEGGTVAITAHGAGEEVYARIRHRGLRLVDTTCPCVRRAQETVAKLVEEGFSIVLYGEVEHPEVRGILSWTGGRGIATQFPDVDVPIGERGIAIISQTTKSPSTFSEFAQAIAKRFTGRVPEIRIVDTTCPETGRRYQSAEELAESVDVLIVVGSRGSANTRKLVETCEATKVPTHHIESAGEIDQEWLEGRERVGVTAGASTPDDVVDEVVRRLAQLADGTGDGSVEESPGSGDRTSCERRSKNG